MACRKGRAGLHSTPGRHVVMYQSVIGLDERAAQRSQELEVQLMLLLLTRSNMSSSADGHFCQFSQNCSCSAFSVLKRMSATP